MQSCRLMRINGDPGAIRIERGRLDRHMQKGAVPGRSQQAGSRQHSHPSSGPRQCQKHCRARLQPGLLHLASQHEHDLRYLHGSTEYSPCIRATYVCHEGLCHFSKHTRAAAVTMKSPCPSCMVLLECLMATSAALLTTIWKEFVDGQRFSSFHLEVGRRGEVAAAVAGVTVVGLQPVDPSACRGARPVGAAGRQGPASGLQSATGEARPGASVRAASAEAVAAAAGVAAVAAAAGSLLGTACAQGRAWQTGKSFSLVMIEQLYETMQGCPRSREHTSCSSMTVILDMFSIFSI